MTNDNRVVCIVDDDRDVRDATSLLLTAAGYTTRCYASGSDFIQMADLSRPGCVLLDLCMPGDSGLAVQSALAEKASPLTVIIVTGHGDVGAAVAAMKAGANDFLEKPYDREALLTALDHCFQSSGGGPAGPHRDAARRRVQQLTPRECQVLQALMLGGTNKQIARHMHVSPRTVEMHRANMMGRLGARSVSEAVRVGYEAGLTAAAS